MEPASKWVSSGGRLPEIVKKVPWGPVAIAVTGVALVTLGVLFKTGQLHPSFMHHVGSFPLGNATAVTGVMLILTAFIAYLKHPPKPLHQIKSKDLHEEETGPIYRFETYKKIPSDLHKDLHKAKENEILETMNTKSFEGTLVIGKEIYFRGTFFLYTLQDEKFKKGDQVGEPAEKREIATEKSTTFLFLPHPETEAPEILDPKNPPEGIGYYLQGEG